MFLYSSLSKSLFSHLFFQPLIFLFPFIYFQEWQYARDNNVLQRERKENKDSDRSIEIMTDHPTERTDGQTEP